jgi:hypothetical protein
VFSLFSKKSPYFALSSKKYGIFSTDGGLFDPNRFFLKSIKASNFSFPALKAALVSFSHFLAASLSRNPDIVF